MFVESFQTTLFGVSFPRIFVSVQPSSTTLFGVPFPLPIPQGRRASQLWTMPKRKIGLPCNATLRARRLLWQPIQEGVTGQGCSEARRPSLASPHGFKFPERSSPPSHAKKTNLNTSIAVSTVWKGILKLFKTTNT